MSIIQKLLAVLVAIVVFNIMGAPVAEAADPKPGPPIGCGVHIKDIHSEEAVEAYRLALLMPENVGGYGEKVDMGKPYHPLFNGHRVSLETLSCNTPWHPTSNPHRYRAGCRCKGVQPGGDGDDTGPPNPFGVSDPVVSSRVGGGGSLPR